MNKVKVTLAKPKIKEVKPVLPTKKEIPPKVVPAVVIPVPVAAPSTEEKSLERTVTIDPTSLTRAKDITPLIRPTPVEREEPTPEPRTLEPIVRESATQTSTATTEARPYAQRESQPYRTTGGATYSTTTPGTDNNPEYRVESLSDTARNQRSPMLQPPWEADRNRGGRSEQDDRIAPQVRDNYQSNYQSRNYDSAEMKDQGIRPRRRNPWE